MFPVCQPTKTIKEMWRKERKKGQIKIKKSKLLKGLSECHIIPKSLYKLNGSVQGAAAAISALCNLTQSNKNKENKITTAQNDRPYSLRE